MQKCMHSGTTAVCQHDILSTDIERSQRSTGDSILLPRAMSLVVLSFVMLLNDVAQCSACGRGQRRRQQALQPRAA